VSKNAEFHADFESVEKVVKKCTKKSYKQNKFDEHGCKREKSAYFRHFFANNFCLVHFFKTFQRIRNQREILRFLTPFLIFSKKNYF
jgi:hypothetical protein